MASTSTHVVGVLLPLPKEEQPFRFLDLPVEIRVVVYNAVDGYVVNHTVCLPPNSDKPFAKLTTVTRVVDLAILHTCKLIRSEARAIMHEKARRWALSTMPKMIFRTVAQRTPSNEHTAFALWNLLLTMPDVVDIILNKDHISFDLLWTMLSVINKACISFKSNGQTLQTARQYLDSRTPMLEATDLDNNPMTYTKVLEMCGCERAILDFIAQAARVLCSVSSSPYSPSTVYPRDGLRIVCGPTNAVSNIGGMSRQAMAGWFENYALVGATGREFRTYMDGLLYEDEQKLPDAMPYSGLTRAKWENGWME